jgi:hypothetical protein
MMSHDETDTGLEDVWYLKEIFWSLDVETPKQPITIITQNFNGEYYCFWSRDKELLADST